ncbi:MAG: RagB/SusD family nutrient uptake outer membrane protein [Candidatus Pseudobacter hemicellulosilyticus]|uniref:RagB/SusD family nutrient uptake outer membrane protein n=1 Tax=Candidatus Pseudobacter hemicellulosilyticus TaxID=3121375 RepID=A0AAJ5WW35_9BACT|nr:MAG: RagB/SusD family nutrient uptake outer membrane protein [Pseudobacter sp.]
MKNKIFQSLLALSLLTGITGCEKRLDIDPVNSIREEDALKTSADVEALLVGAYSDMGDADLYGGSMYILSELMAAGNEVAWWGTFQTYGQVYNHNITVNNAQVANMWMSAYKVINDCNTVLANLNLVVEDRRDKVEGEAKFIRGTVYFDLVRLFAKPWNQGNPTVNDGVPIILTPTKIPLTEENKKARAKVAEVYAQVIQDLLDAESLLGGHRKYTDFFASSEVASAMLARVYLQKGDYPNAAEAADKVISSDVWTLEPTYYDDVFPYDSDNEAKVMTNTTEDVFAIQVTNTAGTNDFFTFYYYRGDITVEPAFFDLFEPDDERQYMYDGDGYIYKYTMQYSNVHIIRLAEMYLTRAEANFREGTAIGAEPVDDVNIIRGRVGLGGYDIADLTLDNIILERKLELALEGFNLQDIKRTEGAAGITSWDSPKLVFPIPDRERKVNTLLTQNDGY